MNRLFSLSDLTWAFPAIRERRQGYFCTSVISGVGRWIKASPEGVREEFAEVRLQAEPGNSFEVQLGHAWPWSVRIEDRDALDEALLKGVIDAILRPRLHVHQCRIVTTGVDCRPGATAVKAVGLAAALAVADMLQRGGWDGDDDAHAAAAAKRV